MPPTTVERRREPDTALPAAGARGRLSRRFARAVDVLGSFGLAAVLLILLMLLTLFGTLEQSTSTLIDVQERYFGSPFVVHYLNGFPIPLPGAMLLLPLLFVNLLVGGMLRLRMGRSTLGVFIIHLGIVVLLAGSWIEQQWSTSGQLLLYEGEASNEYINYQEWELAVAEVRPNGSAREFVIPQPRFEFTEQGGTARFQHPDLPFDVLITEFARNGAPKRMTAAGPRTVDGWTLETLAPVGKADEDQGKTNVAGAYVTLIEKTGGRSHHGLVSGFQQLPWGVEIGDTPWTVDLRRRRWEMPFLIRLDEFIHEVHPGTGMARRFSSYVTQVEDGVERKVHITMNEPLRSGGYTLYQSGWGPQNAPPGAQLYSSFSVVANPSDKVPLWACVIIAIGMLLHFGRKLYYYLKGQRRQQAPVASGGNAR